MTHLEQRLARIIEDADCPNLYRVNGVERHRWETTDLVGVPEKLTCPHCGREWKPEGKARGGV